MTPTYKYMFGPSHPMLVTHTNLTPKIGHLEREPHDPIVET